MVTRRRVLGRVLALAVAQLAVPASLAILARDLYAQGGKPRIEILVLHARKDANGPAMQLGPGVPNLPQLSQPPFNAYNAFSVVGQATLTLDQPKAADPWKGKPSATYTLVTGKPIEVALLDRLPDKRFHIGAAIGKESPDVVRWNAPAGEPVFIAGQTYKDGILVIGITLRAP